MDLALPFLRPAARRGYGDRIETSELLVEELVTALNPASPWELALPATGIFGLSGPSGGGKTTLLAALAGQRPCAGRVIFAGIPWQDGPRGLAVHRRDLALGFQDGRLFAGQSVADNLALAHRYSRRRLAEQERADLIAAFGVAALLEQPVERLSGGEAQRVALLRQLFSNAAVQLYDEPLSAVDRSQVLRRLIPVLKSFWARHPALVIWTSHDLSEIQLLATACLWMEEAVLEGPVPVREAARRLASAGDGEFTCRSRVEARVESCEAGLLTLSVGETPLYADRVAGDHCPGDRVAFLLDSGDISLSIERPGLSSILNCLPVELQAVTPLEDGRVRLRLAAAGQLLSADISHLSCTRLQLEEGGHYYAQFKAGSITGL
ncbi:ATP-binding cassette domain-containing protein [Microbulbifer yueqingensis]|uniref:Molybdate transport system ATP-binding protein n=1 Tax=Microbulbifer yueqingensis TaxID=658219 RepID=A0A1G8XGY5_9GAMM|nr:ATP-binding cassette domain-containing protein [Microbulbifer yueqingensis]SDJ89889.1 molybdate transport system ATP-binding protein [Microbulbifer yueqingensis]